MEPDHAERPLRDRIFNLGNDLRGLSRAIRKQLEDNERSGHLVEFDEDRRES
ncbi:MAG TPA: hypothetical protein VGZ02_12350 [Candidatus Baltobacteraceae bacterium]|jgi:hypothetical protein|nr:hypothetical protein [Candidatus Baltobacteraceae bacterium]